MAYITVIKTINGAPWQLSHAIDTELEPNEYLRKFSRGERVGFYSILEGEGEVWKNGELQVAYNSRQDALGENFLRRAVEEMIRTIENAAIYQASSLPYIATQVGLDRFETYAKRSAADLIDIDTDMVNTHPKKTHVPFAPAPAPEKIVRIDQSGNPPIRSKVNVAPANGAAIAAIAKNQDAENANIGTKSNIIASIADRLTQNVEDVTENNLDEEEEQRKVEAEVARMLAMNTASSTGQPMAAIAPALAIPKKKSPGRPKKIRA